MRAKSTAAVLLLLVAFPLNAQEFLRPIVGAHAERLEEYNSVFLEEELYFASRHRIVEADVDLLIEGSDLSITLFEDTIRIFNTAVHRNGDDIVHWVGVLEGDPLFDVLGSTANSVTISAHAWDLDNSGSALPSSQNRFQFSPAWVVDDADNVTLRQPVREGELVLAYSGPPTEPEEIQRHKRLLELDKQAFFSVSAIFTVSSGDTYVLKPLGFTPRYSVLYEISADTNMPIRADIGLGEEDRRTDAEKRRASEYREFLDSLVDERSKQVRGDVR